MRGSASYQAQRVFHESGINKIGTSKHQAKEIVRKEFDKAGVASTWHRMGKAIGIHSYKTADSYRAVWRNVLEFSKSEFAEKDIEKISGVHVQAFLEKKIEDGVAHATFQQYAAALEKLETALTLYSVRSGRQQEYDFAKGIGAARQMAKGNLTKFTGSRAYQRPGDLIEEMKQSTFRLASKMQLEGGGRINEVNYVQAGQLAGVKYDKLSGVDKGQVSIKGKGGKVNIMQLSVKTYKELKAEVSQKGCFRIEKDAYRKELRAASARSEQKYQGSHGLRWNFAQNRFQEVQRLASLTYEQAMNVVSSEMGHIRADITEHYLRG